MVRESRTLNDSIHSYYIGLLLIGINSGTIFTLVSFTIPYQLSQAKYSANIIGAIFLTSLPYCLKPIYAPFIDRYSIPFLCTKFGQRRGWALAAQLCLSLSISGFLVTYPITNLIVTSILIFTSSLCAAIQDIVLDAYRIERTNNPEELAMATAFSSTGFRIGMLLSSTGALYLSHIFDWYLVYLGTLLLTLLVLIITLSIDEPSSHKSLQTDIAKSLTSIGQYLRIIPTSLIKFRENQPQWLLIILFVFLYKMSDTVPMSMSSQLFINLNFSTQEIASIAKGYGLGLMIIGGFVSGILTSKIGIFKSILICGSIQLLAPIMFAILSWAGYDIFIFTITNIIQNFCCGLGGTTLMIYLSSLCDKEFVATQFAIISSFNSFIRIILSFLAGICASHIEWVWFFILTACFSVFFIPIFLKIYKDKS